jgi:paraquat-inducible protein B
MEDLLKELDKAKAILLVKKSEGGQLILNSLKSDLEGITAKIMREYDKLSHIELLALISHLKAKSDLIETIERSEKQVEILKEELE